MEHSTQTGNSTLDLCNIDTRIMKSLVLIFLLSLGLANEEFPRHVRALCLLNMGKQLLRLMRRCRWA
jgi:hypothetical protein